MNARLLHRPPVRRSCFRSLATAAMLAALWAAPPRAGTEEMDQMWGDQSTAGGVEGTPKAALFRDGNYGMFIHWGLYSHLGGQWKDKTFYGIGEWIKRQMRIPDAEYMALAREFNPTGFDAKAIVKVAKDAGMRWIIITSKHHEGFAMFKSKHPFNIVDATPFRRDPMKELAAACKEAGLGFGFYYSHNQDWTAPGGSNGPTKNADGSPASFDQYFKEKCFPQVDEICSNYGELAFVWFDTPGKMPKEHVVALAELVRKKQPKAMLCSRVGHGMGDYSSLGDMEVPHANHPGLWETCDTTNDSWSFAWYDTNWKDSKQILHRLVSTVGRGGTYLLNVGPDGSGRIPAEAAGFLAGTGAWLRQFPEVIYGAGPSPWGMAQPWGDVTTNKDGLNLVVFDWPQDRQIHLPGLQAAIKSVAWRKADGSRVPVKWKQDGRWLRIDASAIPVSESNPLADVLVVQATGKPTIDTTPGLAPNLPTRLPAEFATATGAEKKRLSWMEKFGEWKFANQVGNWSENGKAAWKIDVPAPGAYQVELIYRGGGRVVWAIDAGNGARIQNQQNSSGVYQAYPMGVLRFQKAGPHTLSVSLVSGDRKRASLESIRLTPAH